MHLSTLIFIVFTTVLATTYAAPLPIRSIADVRSLYTRFDGESDKVELFARKPPKRGADVVELWSTRTQKKRKTTYTPTGYQKNDRAKSAIESWGLGTDDRRSHTPPNPSTSLPQGPKPRRTPALPNRPSSQLSPQQKPTHLRGTIPSTSQSQQLPRSSRSRPRNPTLNPYQSQQQATPVHSGASEMSTPLQGRHQGQTSTDWAHQGHIPTYSQPMRPEQNLWNSYPQQVTPPFHTSGPGSWTPPHLVQLGQTLTHSPHQEIPTYSPPAPVPVPISSYSSLKGAIEEKQ